MKILVTGGLGFVGSHIVDAYVELGHDVWILDNLSTGRMENRNNQAKLVLADITNPESVNNLFEQEKFDIVNHHAAQINVRVSVDDPTVDAHTNIIGGINIYEACVKHGVKKVIFASSGGAVYGEQEYFPADEKHKTDPMSPYGISKLTNEHYLNYYKNVHGLQHVIFRYTNIFGPRQNPHGEAGVISIFIDKILEDSEFVINGNGNATRDYVYVHDVVSANVNALKEDVNGTYNICTGYETSVNDIVRYLKVIHSKDLKYKYGPSKLGEVYRSVANNNLFRQCTNWMPIYPFELNLKDTYNYFKNISQLA